MTIENNDSKRDLSVDSYQAVMRGDLDLAQAIAFLEYEISLERSEFSRIRLKWVKDFVTKRSGSDALMFPVRGSLIPHCVVDFKDGKPVLDLSAPPTTRISTGSEFVHVDSAEGKAVLSSLGR